MGHPFPDRRRTCGRTGYGMELLNASGLLKVVISIFNEVNDVNIAITITCSGGNAEDGGTLADVWIVAAENIVDS